MQRYWVMGDRTIGGILGGRILLETQITRKIMEKLNKMENCRVMKLHGNQYTINGTPDLLIVKEGQTYFMEVKRRGNKATPKQLFELRKWAGAGAITGGVYSVDEAINMIGGNDA